MATKLFKLLIVSIIVLNVAFVTAVTAITIHHPPRRVKEASSACTQAPAVSAAPATRSSKGLSLGKAALLTMHTLLAMACATWLLGRALACADRPYPLPGEGKASEGTLGYLQDQTREAGGFVVLAHAAEDLALQPGELEAALAEVRRQDPELELRVVAERWILRRPRV